MNKLVAVSDAHTGLVCSDHMARFLHTKDLHHYLDLAIKAVRKQDFDTIAFRGMSGAMAAPVMALALNKNLILVRKDGDKTHSKYLVEGYKLSLRYVIVDDFICTGDTARAIRDSIKDFAPKAKCIGVLPIQRLNHDEIEVYEREHLCYPLSRIPSRRKGTVDQE